MKVSCTRRGGSWESPDEVPLDILRHARTSGQSIAAMKSLRNGTGLNLASSKAMLHHVAGLNRCRIAYINDDAHVIRLTQKPARQDDEWELWRQDDGGHQFLIARYATREDAEKMMKTYEDRGHKQVYWVRKAEEKS